MALNHLTSINYMAALMGDVAVPANATPRDHSLIRPPFTRSLREDEPVADPISHMLSFNLFTH